MYDRQRTETFYDTYGDAEWNRLEKTRPYGYLQAIIHTDLLKRNLKANDIVLDAGSGPGRFAIEMALLGAKVTLLDISSHQLDQARRNITSEGLAPRVGGFVNGDICDLGMFADGIIDAVVCFGGALSYVCDRRASAAAELERVTRPGGTILVSVMSLAGSSLTILGNPRMLEDPSNPAFGTPGFWDVLESGDLAGAPSRNNTRPHPPMHLYSAQDLASLFKRSSILEAAGSNVTIRPSTPGLVELANNERAWATIVELEQRLCSKPGLIESGNHLIMVLRRATTD